MKIKILSLFVICHIACITMAQKTPEYLRNIYTANDGLPSTKTGKLFQDSRNYLWIGSSMGISCFDGQIFTNYTDKDGLPSNVIQCISEDCRGTLFVGTSNGLARFNGSRFVLEKLNANPSTPLMINHLLCHNDTLWISTSDGLYIKMRDTVKKINLGDPRRKVVKLCMTRYGNKIVATNMGLMIYEHGGQEISYLKGKYILDIYSDESGDCWIATLSGETYLLRKGLISELPFPDRPELTTTRINGSENELWFLRTNIISVFRNGSHAYDISGLDYAHNNFLSDILTDCEGNHWISSNNGLIRLRKTSFVRYKINDKLDASVYVINALNSGQIIVGGNMQLFSIDEDSLKIIYPKITPNLVSDISFVSDAPQGGLLIGQNLGGLSLLKDGKMKLLDKSDGVFTLRMFCCAKDRRGDVWVGSNNVLYKIGSDIISYKINEPGGRNILSLLALDGEELLTVGTNKGLYLFRNGRFDLIREVPELMESVVQSLVMDGPNRVIIGVKGKGIFATEFNDGKFKILNKFNKSNGLGSDFVLRVIVDSYHQIWALTGNGVYRIKSYLSSRPIVEYIGREEGMPDNSWSEGALYALESGKLFVGGSRGLVSMDGNMSLSHGVRQLKPLFTKIVSGKNGLDLLTDSIFWNNSLPSVEINYTDNSFSVHFNCAGFTYVRQIRFSSFLEGYDQTWSAENTARFVTYNNLPPGEYKLHLKVSTLNDNLDTVSTILFIKIKTPFWMTWWFRSIIVLGCVYLLYLIFLWRKNEQIARHVKEMEINQKISESRFIAFQARMNPHFIFNCLNAIQYFIVHNDKESTLNYLSKFARLLRQILDNSLESSVTVESELQMLTSYLDMESMRFENKFVYHIETVEGFDPASTEIPAMILQPFVENAIVHGLLHKKGRGHLKIHMEKSGSNIICAIQDDGIGRKRSELQNSKRSPNHRSHGMSIALKRLEILAGETHDKQKIIEIRDIDKESFDTGTEIIIRLPIII